MQINRPTSSDTPHAPAFAHDSKTRAEKALLDANQRLQSILRANEVGTWTWDIVPNKVAADPNMARLFGVTPEDAAGGPIENYFSAIHPSDRERVSDAVAKALEGPNDRYEVDYRILKQDGTISWLIARGIVERDPEGKPKYFPGVVIDITERKTAEQQLEELHFRLQQQLKIFDLTLSSISDFAYIFDQQGKFAFVNQALLDLWGLKLEEAVGKDFHELNYPFDLATRLQHQIRQVFDTKLGLKDETPYTSPTGAGGYYEYIFRPVFDRAGNVELVAGSTRDISDRKQIEEELRRSKESFQALAGSLEQQVATRTIELEDRNKDVLAQSEQLRDLSVRLINIQDQERRHIARELHDSAGQIIAALSMNLGMLITQLKASTPGLVPLAEQTRAYAKELEQEVRTTSYLLHPPLLDETGLRAALGWYVEGLKSRAGLQVELDMDVDFERPSRAIELTVFRVVQECLTNVHRHSECKSATIRIARDGSNILLEVRDTGHGMAPDTLAKVRAKGVGVGLRGIRERIRQIGGELIIESELHKGTTVRVTLPLTPGI
jgi:PAS domain S-box-containing protein